MPPQDDQSQTTEEAADFRAAVKAFLHSKPRPQPCEHDFQGWREFAEGGGGEQVCTKCGMGAMAWTLAKEGWG